MKKRQRLSLYANQIKQAAIEAEGFCTDVESSTKDINPDLQMCPGKLVLEAHEAWALPRFRWTNHPNVMRTVACTCGALLCECPKDLKQVLYCRQCGARVET